MDGGNGNDLQVVGQGDLDSAGPQQRGTIQHTESGNSLPPVTAQGHDAASTADTLNAADDPEASGTAP